MNRICSAMPLIVFLTFAACAIETSTDSPGDAKEPTVGKAKPPASGGSDSLGRDGASAPHIETGVSGTPHQIRIAKMDPALPAANSSLLDTNGGFTLFVSNQSFAIDPVDVRVEINGELVVSDYFRVGTQHTFVPFKLSLPKGKHRIRIWSMKGDAELSMELDLRDHDVGVVTYWYYPKSHYNPTPRKFNFRTQNGPLEIM